MVPRDWHSDLDAIIYINLDRRSDRRQRFVNQMCGQFRVPQGKLFRYPAVDYPSLPALGCSVAHIKILEALLELAYSNGPPGSWKSEVSLTPEQEWWNVPLRSDWRFVMVCEDDFEWRYREKCGLDSAFARLAIGGGGGGTTTTIASGSEGGRSSSGRGLSSTSRSSWFDVLQIATSAYDFHLREPGHPEGSRNGVEGGVKTGDDGEYTLPPPSTTGCPLRIERVFHAQTTGGYILPNKPAFLLQLLGNFRFGVTKLAETRKMNEWAIDQHWKRLQEDPRINWYIPLPVMGQQASGHSDILRRYQRYHIPP